MLSILNQHGVIIDSLLEKTSLLKSPKGRCETIQVKDAYAVVDYAHTPDAVEKVISTYNDLKKSKVITIIGCGGDRDPKKRPLMGEIATRLSDYVIITNDNPRFESPTSIVGDVVSGMSCQYKVILNRSQATEFALSIAKVDDTVAILGKGSEKYQEIKGRKFPYCDVDVVHKIINKQGE